jgi:hydroxymethylbilane synthase
VTTLRLATRKSALALAQSGQVAARVEAANPGVIVELLHVVTEGDRIQDRPLAAIGGKGLFVKEIEAALLDGRADFAVHSMKDLPGQLPDGLAVVCVPTRESPWDLLVTVDARPLAALPEGARVGTSSQRRAVQLRARRADLRIEMLRGNIDTRLRRLREGAFDAVVLAEAGVRRLGLDAPGIRLEWEMIPAVAQGALALEARAGDDAVARLLAPLHDPVTALETAAERSVMIALSGSCVTPLGALARLSEDRATLRLAGFLAREDGSAWTAASRDERFDGSATAAEALGGSLAEELWRSLRGGV